MGRKLLLLLLWPVWGPTDVVVEEVALVVGVVVTAEAQVAVEVGVGG